MRRAAATGLSGEEARYDDDEEKRRERGGKEGASPRLRRGGLQVKDSDMVELIEKPRLQ